MIIFEILDHYSGWFIVFFLILIIVPPILVLRKILSRNSTRGGGGLIGREGAERTTIDGQTGRVSVAVAPGHLTRQMRELQDNLRNAGWRIQWIPWQAAGRPERIYSTRLSCLAALVGVLLFLGSLGFFFAYPFWFDREPPKWSPAILCFGAFGGLAIILLGKIYAVRQQQQAWVQVRAKCVDREIREVRQRTLGNEIWDYRLLCEFDYGGKQYAVTPETAWVMALNSEQAARQYLEERIDADGNCTLWINPENPLQACFHERKRI